MIDHLTEYIAIITRHASSSELQANQKAMSLSKNKMIIKKNSTQAQEEVEGKELVDFNQMDTENIIGYLDREIEMKNSGGQKNYSGIICQIVQSINHKNRQILNRIKFLETPNLRDDKICSSDFPMAISKAPLQKLEDTVSLAKSIIERLQQATIQVHSETSPEGREKIFQQPVGVQADLTQDHVLPALGMAVNQIN